MTERDKELAKQAEACTDRDFRDFKGEINWAEAYESKLIALIRADEREACKILGENFACSPAMFPTMAEYKTYRDAIFSYQKAIRARGNSV